MPAPTRSLRPKMRPKRIEDEAMINEGSTRSPDGIYVTDRDNADAVNRGNSDARRRAEEGSPSDTQKFMGGGMVKKGYMGGGVVRIGDVRDNPNRGKTY